jgi:hypothetical protein
MFGSGKSSRIQPARVAPSTGSPARLEQITTSLFYG